MIRCAWASNERLTRYHDEEWGTPLHDDQRLFEFLVLEGAQAGLSWDTVLRKRDGYREVFDRFDPALVAGYEDVKIGLLLSDPGIIRNRAKIAAAIRNARAVLAIQEELGSFDQYIWSFVGGRPRINQWRTADEIPTSTAESAALSKDLRRRGCAFVGPTICYAFMQATGMVNDHVADCFRHPGS